LTRKVTGELCLPKDRVSNSLGRTWLGLSSWHPSGLILMIRASIRPAADSTATGMFVSTRWNFRLLDPVTTGITTSGRPTAELQLTMDRNK